MTIPTLLRGCCRERATLRLSHDGDPCAGGDGLPDGCADVFLSTYVLDLLDDGDTDAVLALAARLLRPGGQLCLTGGYPPPYPLAPLSCHAGHAREP